MRKDPGLDSIGGWSQARGAFLFPDLFAVCLTASLTSSLSKYLSGSEKFYKMLQCWDTQCVSYWMLVT